MSLVGLVGLRKVQGVLGDEVEDHLAANRSDSEGARHRPESDEAVLLAHAVAAADDFTFTCDRQTIFVIQRRVIDFNQNVTFRQLCVIDLLDTSDSAFVFLV